MRTEGKSFFSARRGFLVTVAGSGGDFGPKTKQVRF